MTPHTPEGTVDKTLADRLLAAKSGHYDCDDCWYSCAILTCDDHRKSTKCDCGADTMNALLDEAIAALPALPAAEGWVSVGEQDIYEMGRFAKVPGTQLAALLGVIKSAGCAIVRLPAPPAAGDV